MTERMTDEDVYLVMSRLGPREGYSGFQDVQAIRAELRRARASEAEKEETIRALRAEIAELRDEIRNTAIAWSIESLRGGR